MSKKALQKVALNKAKRLAAQIHDMLEHDYLSTYPQDARYDIDHMISSLRSAWDDYYILSDFLEEREANEEE